MAEESLDRAQIGAAGEQMGSERVTQLMRRSVATERPRGRGRNDASECAASHGCALATDKECAARYWPRLAVGAQAWQASTGDGQQALLVALTAGFEHAAVEVHVDVAQLHGF